MSYLVMSLCCRMSFCMFYVSVLITWSFFFREKEGNAIRFLYLYTLRLYNLTHIFMSYLPEFYVGQVSNLQRHTFMHYQVLVLYRFVYALYVSTSTGMSLSVCVFFIGGMRSGCYVFIMCVFRSVFMSCQLEFFSGGEGLGFEYVGIS